MAVVSASAVPLLWLSATTRLILVLYSTGNAVAEMRFPAKGFNVSASVSVVH